jgi:hypothetical protein
LYGGNAKFQRVSTKIIVQHYRNKPNEAPVSFMVSLWRNGTAKLFHGTSTPNASGEVTTFTIP